MVQLKKFKILGVDKMVNYEFFTADGAIGLGFIPEATDDESIEEDTNFMSMILSNVSHKSHKI